MSCFHIKEGCIDIPTAYSNLLSSDANIESSSSEQGQDLRVFRKDDVVGLGMLIFVTDGSLQSKAKFEIVREFFMNLLGFKNDHIVLLDKKEVDTDNVNGVKLKPESVSKLSKLVEDFY